MKRFSITLNFLFSFLKKKSKFKAFTLAEILLSLSIIGIVAAIALPSLLGNVNERAWETQKKALYTRFSQSIPLLPSLNGYGELKGNLSTCASTNSCFNDDELVDTAAESFVRDGLSKVMKITNICDNEHLGDCGLPDKIIPIDGGAAINLSSINTLSGLNSISVSLFIVNLGTVYEMLDTKAAAFETVNGESILAYYNPNCETNLGELDNHLSQPKMCANFIYDLNGKKGPNTVGKDIGVITAFYSTDPVIVAPKPYPTDSAVRIGTDEIDAKCKELGDDAKVPTLDELNSMFYNMKLFGINRDVYWSSTVISPYHSKWVYSFSTGSRMIWGGSNDLRCVKR